MADRRQQKWELQPGEELVWSGRPCAEKEYGRADWLLVPLFGALLAVCTLFGMFIVFSVVRFGFSAGRLGSILLWLAASAFAVYGYFFRFAVKRRAKSNVTYAVTSFCRVMILDGKINRVQTVDRGEVRDAYISESDQNGVGTIYFGRRPLGSFFHNTGLDIPEGIGVQRALFDVADCATVLKKMKRGR